MTGRSLVWYFDYISPFAYLQFRQFRKVLAGADIRYTPILFAALLNHWGQKGPAELETKRVFTYRHVAWLGSRLGFPIRMPPAHPFVPLKPLRLTLAFENTPEVIDEIFRFIWEDGRDVDREFAALAARLKIANAEELISRPEVKDQLRRNTEQALARGVFGVPTTVVDGELFWGFDSTDMLLEYLDDPSLLSTPEMRRISALPKGAERRG